MIGWIILIIILILITRILWKVHMTSWHLNKIIPSKKTLMNPLQYGNDLKEAKIYFIMNSPKWMQNMSTQIFKDAKAVANM